MPTFKVAHIREQGIDLIIIPLDRTFGSKSSTEQNEIINELQARSNNAGLAGTVVPVWEGGGRRMTFIAPTRWHPFFKSLNLQLVLANINKQVSW